MNEHELPQPPDEFGLVRNALRTPDGTVLESHSRHDYKEYTDANGKTYMVDGGLDYARRTAHEDQVEMCVWSDDDHLVVREALKWGTRGKDGKQPLKWVLICDMTTDHIQACLDTQHQMRGYIRRIMENELAYRKEQA